MPAASDTSLPPPQEPKHIGGAFRMERFDVWKGGFREILGNLVVNCGTTVNPGLINPKRLFNWEGTI